MRTTSIALIRKLKSSIALSGYGRSVAPGFVILALLYPIWYGFALFVPEIGRATSWSRGAVSGALAILLVTHALASAFAGRACDRIGVRKTIRIGGVLLGLGLILSSRSQAPLHFYFGYGVLGGLGLCMGGWVPVVSAINQSVDRRLVGTATGIAATGIGLGLLITAPLLQWAITRWGWRLTLRAEGVIIFLCVQLVASFLRGGRSSQNRPSQDGESGSEVPIIRLADFWVLLATFFSFSFSFQLVQAHQVAYLLGAQWTPMAAASVLAIVAALSLPGKPLLGILSDRFGSHRVYSAGAVCLIGAIVVLLRLGSNPNWTVGFGVYTFLFSIAYCVIAPVYSSLATHHFGRLVNYSSVFGTLMTGSGLGSALGVYGGGLVFDSTGNYATAFIFAGFVAFLSIPTMYAASQINRP